LRNKQNAPGRRSGFTLLEIAVVIAIGTLLVLMIGSVLLGMQGLSLNVEAAARGTSTASRILDPIAKHLASGARVVAFNDTALLVHEPVDGDGDGDFVDVNGNPQWGANAIEGWAYEYLWISTGTISEGAEGADLNGDGDQADSFDEGDLVLRVVDGSGSEQERRGIAGNGIVLQDTGGLELPPLFSMPFLDTVEIDLAIRIVNKLRSDQKVSVLRGRKIVTLR